MSDDSGTDKITTAAEFQTALEELLTTARQNDIDLRGSWVYRNGDESLASWEVEIYELQQL